MNVLEGAVAERREDQERFKGGFKALAPMFSTQLYCIVGSPENLTCPPNIVFIWDDYTSELKGEIRFRSEVKNVLMRRDKVVIILEKTVKPYADLRVPTEQAQSHPHLAHCG